MDAEKYKAQMYNVFYKKMKESQSRTIKVILKHLEGKAEREKSFNKLKKMLEQNPKDYSFWLNRWGEFKKDVNILKDKEWSILGYACMYGHNKIINILLNEIKIINHKPNDLVMAVENGDTKTVQLLLNRGLKINKLDSRGDTPLISAALRGSPEVVQLLLDRRAKINKVDNNGNTALIEAANATTRQGKKGLKKLKLLLNRGAKKTINKTNNKGETALIRAAYGDGGDPYSTKAVKALLDKGAKINKTDNEGKTALMIAVKYGNIKTVKILLDKGAKIDKKDLNKKRAIDHIENIKSIAKHINTMSEDGEREYRKIKKLLIKKEKQNGEMSINVQQKKHKLVQKINTMLSQADNVNTILENPDFKKTFKEIRSINKDFAKEFSSAIKNLDKKALKYLFQNKYPNWNPSIKES